MTSAMKRAAGLREAEIVPKLARFLRLETSAEVKSLRSAVFPPLLCSAASAGNVDLLERLKASVRALLLLCTIGEFRDASV